MTAPLNNVAFSCLILGDESLTIACADMIVSGGHRVVAVVSTDADVRAWAQAQGVAVYSRPADLTGADLPTFDWLLSIANLRIIPEAVLALPTKGAVNFHDGPLPRYAGLNTPAWAIINGEAQHGVSWHMIEGGVDEGDLLAQELIEIAAASIPRAWSMRCSPPTAHCSPASRRTRRPSASIPNATPQGWRALAACWRSWSVARPSGRRRT